MLISRLVSYYDDPHYDYQKYWQGRKYEDQSERQALAKLLKDVSGNKIMADIGGGFGRLTPVYASHFKQCYIIDPSSRMLKEAKKLKKKYPHLLLRQGFVENLPLRDNFLDLALIVRTFHHLSDPHRAIKELYRVIKPSGYLILEFPNKIHFKNFLEALIKMDFHSLSQQPEDISTRENVAPFFNFHPLYIKKMVKNQGFYILKTLSVSNFRLPLLKKILPLPVMMFLESAFSAASEFMPLLRYFGPSVFLLARKRKI